MQRLSQEGVGEVFLEAAGVKRDGFGASRGWKLLPRLLEGVDSDRRWKGMAMCSWRRPAPKSVAGTIACLPGMDGDLTSWNYTKLEGGKGQSGGAGHWAGGGAGRTVRWSIPLHLHDCQFRFFFFLSLVIVSCPFLFLLSCPRALCSPLRCRSFLSQRPH